MSLISITNNNYKIIGLEADNNSWFKIFDIKENNFFCGHIIPLDKILYHINHKYNGGEEDILICPYCSHNSFNYENVSKIEGLFSRRSFKNLKVVHNFEIKKEKFFISKIDVPYMESNQKELNIILQQCELNVKKIGIDTIKMIKEGYINLDFYLIGSEKLKKWIGFFITTDNEKNVRKSSLNEETKYLEGFLKTYVKKDELSSMKKGLEDLYKKRILGKFHPRFKEQDYNYLSQNKIEVENNRTSIFRYIKEKISYSNDINSISYILNENSFRVDPFILINVICIEMKYADHGFDRYILDFLQNKIKETSKKNNSLDAYIGIFIYSENTKNTFQDYKFKTYIENSDYHLMLSPNLIIENV